LAVNKSSARAKNIGMMVSNTPPAAAAARGLLSDRAGIAITLGCVHNDYLRLSSLRFSQNFFFAFPGFVRQLAGLASQAAACAHALGSTLAARGGIAAPDLQRAEGGDETVAIPNRLLMVSERMELKR